MISENQKSVFTFLEVLNIVLVKLRGSNAIVEPCFFEKWLKSGTNEVLILLLPFLEVSEKW